MGDKLSKRGASGLGLPQTAKGVSSSLHGADELSLATRLSSLAVLSEGLSSGMQYVLFGLNFGFWRLIHILYHLA